MSDPKIKYDIEAAVKGEDSVEALAGKLKELGDVLEGGLKQSAHAAAGELDALGSKQRAIDGFTALKRETQDLSSALTQATAVVDRLGPQLAEAATKTQAMSAAERAAAAAVAEAQASLQRKRDALKDLNAETTGAARNEEAFRATQSGLKSSIAEATAEVKARRNALNAAQQEARAAGNAELALSAEYDKARKGAASLSLELGNKNRALAASREALQSAGIGTTNLAQAQRNLQGAVGEVRERVAAMAPAYAQAAAASTASTQTQAQNQRTLREGITSISTQLQRVQQIATVALGGSYVGELARSVAQTADEFKNLQARVQITTGAGEAFRSSWEGITRVALQTNSALDETATLFSRLHRAAKEGGDSAQLAQERALELTRTINQAIQLSGGSAESAQAAITQLIQGLQSGVLRGEEFNSVMQQAPRLAQALAEGLGVTTGELRKMAEAGQLTTATVMRSLRDQSDAVQAEFEKLPTTVGRALQNLSSQWTLYVGASDKGLVSSATAAKVLNTLAENLDLVVSSLTAVGKVWAATRVAALAADFGAWVTKTLASTVALEANTVASGANAAAQTRLAAANAEVAVAQTAATAATVANTAARASNAGVWSSIASFVGQATTATNAATVATKAGTAAAVAKTGVLGLLGKAVGGLTRLLGGPVGLVATAYAFSGEIKRGATNVLDYALSFTDAGRQLKAFEEQQSKVTQAERAAGETRKMVAGLLRQQAEASEKARASTLGLSKAAQAALAEFDKVVAKSGNVDEALSSIGKDFDLASAPGIQKAAAVLDQLVSTGRITAAQFEGAWADALKGEDLGVFEARARAALMGVRVEADRAAQALQDAIARGVSGKELEAFEQRARAALSAAGHEAERFAGVLDAQLREAIRRTGVDMGLLKDGMSAAAAGAITDADVIISNLERIRAQGLDVARTLEGSLRKAIDTADSVKELEALRQRIGAVRKDLGEKLAQTLLDEIETKSLRAQEALTSVGRAAQKLGITSRAEADLTARQYGSAYAEIAASGKYSLEQQAEAFAKWSKAAQESGNPVIKGQVELARSVLKMKAEVAGVGDLFEREYGRAGAAASKAAEAHNSLVAAMQQVPISLGGTNPIRSAGGKDNRLAADGGPDFSTVGGKAGPAVDNSGIFGAWEAYLAGRLGPGDLDMLRKLLQASNDNARLSSKYGSFQGSQSATMWAERARRMVEHVEGMAAAAQAPTSAAQAGAGATRNVNISFNGTQLGSVRTDAAGDRVLQQLLDRLEQEARRAGP